VTAVHLSELVDPPEGGRVFSETLRPGLADCAPSGRIRLDALARWLQDVAYADVVDAGLADSAVWVIRRARMHVRRFPQFGAPYRLSTFCSGLGRMWAERRTTIARADGDAAGEPDVEAVALWVHLDPETLRPSPLTEAEAVAYGVEPERQRRVTARLRHPGPAEEAERGTWHFRAAELDLAGHVNNAAYWAPLEEELVTGGEDPSSIDVEMEYRNPAQPGEKALLRDGAWRWIVDPGGALHASLLLAR
jgi:acyl-ACP thioesterase